MNNNITQEAIAESHTSQPDKNIISAQVQMPRMARQRGGNAVATNNDVSFTVFGSSKHFFIQYVNDGRLSGLVISKITSRNRRVSSKNITKHDVEIGYNSTIEIDSYAGTIFFW